MTRSILTPREHQRYSRHILLPEVGLAGQLKLKNARVLVVGTGGLGSPIAMYLAAAGVGTIGLVEFDDVDLSNLQRQILFRDQDVGHSKLRVAEQRLRDLNPDIQVIPFESRLEVENARSIISQFDWIVDGTDNFETRYLINDACFFEKKVLIHGSIFRFEGQVSVFDSSRGPCYRCLYPKPPGDGLIPNCAEAGVIGALPGMVGTIQANEVIKCLLGIGEPLLGRLLCVDVLEMRFREFEIARSPSCSLCGSQPSITEMKSEGAACDLTSEWPGEISAAELMAWRASGKNHLLLDVREPHEYQDRNLGGVLIPLGELARQIEMGALNHTQCIVVHCASGVRSRKAGKMLIQAGFRDVWNLTGGIQAVPIGEN